MSESIYTYSPGFFLLSFAMRLAREPERLLALGL